MAKKFLNTRDLAMRLDETICFVKGKPHHVKYEDMHGEDEIVLIKKFGGSNWKQYKYTSDDFVVGFAPLGNINYANKVYHATRLPGRSQKWGITPRSVTFTRRGDRVEFIELFYSTEFSESLQNIYPSVGKALDSIKVRPGERAFSSNFSFVRSKTDKMIRCYHESNECIGTVDKDDAIVLDSSVNGVQYLHKELKMIEGVKVKYEEAL